MERTTKVKEDPKPKDERYRYKKIGGGSLRLNRKIIKPGEIFMALPQDVAKFKGMVLLLDKAPVKETDDPIEEIKGKITAYKVVPRGKSNTWFNVVGPNGKVLNEKALKKDTADLLVKDLSK